jgi:hypothetical protein
MFLALRVLDLFNQKYFSKVRQSCIWSRNYKYSSSSSYNYSELVAATQATKPKEMSVNRLMSLACNQKTVVAY